MQRELEFWRSSSCVAQYNAQPIWLSPSAIRLVYSGGYTVEHGLHVAQGSWLPGEAAQSSTGREMVVVLRVLDSIAHKLCNMRVLVGSRQPHLQTELLKIAILYLIVRLLVVSQ